MQWNLIIGAPSLSLTRDDHVLVENQDQGYTNLECVPPNIYVVYPMLQFQTAASIFLEQEFSPSSLFSDGCLNCSSCSAFRTSGLIIELRLPVSTVISHVAIHGYFIFCNYVTSCMKGTCFSRGLAKKF